MGVKASSLPPPCRVPAPICGSMAPNNSCPVMWKATSLGVESRDALARSAIDWRAEEDRVQVRHAQPLAKATCRCCGRCARPPGGERPAFALHNRLPDSPRPGRRSPRSGLRASPCARTSASTTLGCWNARCEECTVTTAAAPAATSQPRCCDQRESHPRRRRAPGRGVGVVDRAAVFGGQRRQHLPGRANRSR